MNGIVVRILLTALLFHNLFLMAQSRAVIQWNFQTQKIDNDEVNLLITAILPEAIHIYSIQTEEGGPLPTRFTYQPGKAYKLIGSTKEVTVPEIMFDSTFLMNIAWFERKVTFSQRIKMNAPTVLVEGKIDYMICSNGSCYPPSEKKFKELVSR